MNSSTQPLCDEVEFPSASARYYRGLLKSDVVVELVIQKAPLAGERQEGRLVAWSEIGTQRPDFIRTVEKIFGRSQQKIVATIRLDGSPRLSGIEADFHGNDLWLISVWGSLKTIDLLRDPRFALHSATEPLGTDWTGDAKISGMAIEVDDNASIEHLQGRLAKTTRRTSLFRAEIVEVVLTRLGSPPDHLLIESWHEGSFRIHRLEQIGPSIGSRDL